MLKAVERDYYFKNGSPVFVYGVTGTPEELVQYEAAQKANGFFVADKTTNQPLFFSPGRPLGQTCELRITANGRVVAYNPAKVVAEAEEMQHLIRAERAKAIAQRSLGMLGGQSGRSSTFQTVLPGAEFADVDNAGNKGLGNPSI